MAARIRIRSRNDRDRQKSRRWRRRHHLAGQLREEERARGDNWHNFDSSRRDIRNLDIRRVDGDEVEEAGDDGRVAARVDAEEVARHAAADAEGEVGHDWDRRSEAGDGSRLGVGGGARSGCAAHCHCCCSAP